ncbi:MAG TPA: hypothetical protein VGC21_23055 [Telluria sp.]|jgi:hypothetical protein
MSSGITLKLTIQGAQLVLTIVNSSDQALRLWEWHNSWGWDALSFELVRDDVPPVTISHKPREWTKNGPDYFDVAPHQSSELSVDLHDGWWGPAGADQDQLAQAGWRDQAVRLRARLQILPTPESDRLGTFTGTVYSEWTSSRPPNDWL